MTDIIHPERTDEFKEVADKWADEGCLPASSDHDADLNVLKRMISKAPAKEKSKMVDMVAARALLARENKKISDDICRRVFEILEVSDDDNNNERLLRLVQS